MTHLLPIQEGHLLTGLHGQPLMSRYRKVFREFRPLVSALLLQSSCFRCFCGFLGCFLGWFFGLRVVSSVVASPLTNMLSFQPSHDDLGTPPTRRPHSWKKTKKIQPMMPPLVPCSSMGIWISSPAKVTGMRWKTIDRSALAGVLSCEFFCTSGDAMCAGCTGHLSKAENSASLRRGGEPNTKEQKTKQTENQNKSPQAETSRVSLCTTG